MIPSSPNCEKTWNSASRAIAPRSARPRGSRGRRAGAAASVDGSRRGAVRRRPGALAAPARSSRPRSSRCSAQLRTRPLELVEEVEHAAGRSPPPGKRGARSRPASTSRSRSAGSPSAPHRVRDGRRHRRRRRAAPRRRAARAAPGTSADDDRAAERQRLERRQVLGAEAGSGRRARARAGRARQLVGRRRSRGSARARRRRARATSAPDVLELALVGADADELESLAARASSASASSSVGVVLVRPELRGIEQVGLADAAAVEHLPAAAPPSAGVERELGRRVVERAGSLAARRAK